MAELAGGKLRVDEPAPHVTRLTIDNPAKRNALDHDILDALAALLPGLEARCLLLTAGGKVFSAGYDIGALRSRSSPRPRRRSSHAPSPPRSRRSTPTRTRSWRPSAGTRSAAGWSSRCRATCGSAAPKRGSACRPRGSAWSTRTPGCGFRSSRPCWRRRTPPARA